MRSMKSANPFSEGTFIPNSQLVLCERVICVFLGGESDDFMWFCVLCALLGGAADDFCGRNGKRCCLCALCLC